MVQGTAKSVPWKACCTDTHILARSVSLSHTASSLKHGVQGTAKSVTWKACTTVRTAFSRNDAENAGMQRSTMPPSLALFLPLPLSLPPPLPSPLSLPV
eukprot:1429568-Rhodomonas_salina.1